MNALLKEHNEKRKQKESKQQKEIALMHIEQDNRAAKLQNSKEKPKGKRCVFDFDIGK